MNIELAKKVLEFVHIQGRDKSGKPTVVLCPAHNGQVARVSIARKDNDLICCCDKLPILGDASEPKPCEAEQGRVVCYHVLAAILKVSKEAGCLIYFHADHDKAEALRNKPGNGRAKLVRICAGNAFAFGVVFPPKEAPQVKPLLPVKPVQPSGKITYLCCPECTGTLRTENAKDGPRAGEPMQICCGPADLPTQGGCGWRQYMPSKPASKPQDKPVEKKPDNPTPAVLFDGGGNIDNGKPKPRSKRKSK